MLGGKRLSGRQQRKDFDKFVNLDYPSNWPITEKEVMIRARDRKKLEKEKLKDK